MDLNKERVKRICEDYDGLNSEERRKFIEYICKMDLGMFSVVPKNNLRIRENSFQKEARDY